MSRERERLKLATDNILRICLTDSSISAKSFIAQIEAELSSIIEYNHDETNFRLACGIELPDKELIAEQLRDTSHNKTSKMCQSFESLCSKRELAVLFVGAMLSISSGAIGFDDSLKKTKKHLEKLLDYQSEIEEEIRNIPDYLSDEEKDKEFNKIMNKYLNK